MFQSKQLLLFLCLFICLNTLFHTTTAKTRTVEGTETNVSKRQKKRAKKIKKETHDKCDITSHHHHKHEINLEQELKAVYIYKILSNHAIWNKKDIKKGLKIAVIGKQNAELIEKLDILSREVAHTELPFTVEIWNKNMSLNLSEYHAIVINDTEAQLFRNITQIAQQNDIITFSSMKDKKSATLETTVQFLVINNKLKFSLARESVGRLVHEDLWKKSYKL